MSSFLHRSISLPGSSILFSSPPRLRISTVFLSTVDDADGHTLSAVPPSSAMRPAVPPKSSLLTLSLAGPSSLDSLVHDDRSQTALYAIHTHGSTTTVSRSDLQQSFTQVAEISWPRNPRRPGDSKGKAKDNKHDEASIQIGNEEWTTVSSFMKETHITRAHKFQIPSYGHPLRWKRVGAFYHCNTNTVKGPVATLDPSSKRLTLRVHETFHDRYAPGPEADHEGVSVVLLDYLLVTAILLTTDPCAWNMKSQEDVTEAHRPHSGESSMLASSQQSQSVIPDRQWRKIVYGEPLYPSIRSDTDLSVASSSRSSSPAPSLSSGALSQVPSHVAPRPVNSDSSAAAAHRWAEDPSFSDEEPPAAAPVRPRQLVSIPSAQSLPSTSFTAAVSPRPRLRPSASMGGSGSRREREHPHPYAAASFDSSSTSPSSQSRSASPPPPHPPLSLSPPNPGYLYDPERSRSTPPSPLESGSPLGSSQYSEGHVHSPWAAPPPGAHANNSTSSYYYTSNNNNNNNNNSAPYTPSSPSSSTTHEQLGQWGYAHGASTSASSSPVPPATPASARRRRLPRPPAPSLPAQSMTTATTTSPPRPREKTLPSRSLPATPPGPPSSMEVHRPKAMYPPYQPPQMTTMVHSNPHHVHYGGHHQYHQQQQQQQQRPYQPPPPPPQQHHYPRSTASFEQQLQQGGESVVVPDDNSHIHHPHRHHNIHDPIAQELAGDNDSVSPLPDVPPPAYNQIDFSDRARVLVPAQGLTGSWPATSPAATTAGGSSGGREGLRE